MVAMMGSMVLGSLGFGAAGVNGCCRYKYAPGARPSQLAGGRRERRRHTPSRGGDLLLERLTAGPAYGPATTG